MYAVNSKPSACHGALNCLVVQSPLNCLQQILISYTGLAKAQDYASKIDLVT